MTNTDSQEHTLLNVTIPQGADQFEITPTADNTCVNNIPLALGASCLMSYRIAPIDHTQNKHFDGVFEAQFDDVTYSKHLSFDFTDQSNLPSNALTFLNEAIISPQSNLVFSFETNSKINQLALKLPEAQDLRDILDLEHINGGVYNATNNEININYDLLKGTQHEITIPVKSTAQAVLSKYLNELSNNGHSNVFVFHSPSIKAQAPVLKVNASSPLLIDNHLLSLNDTSVHNVMITNLSPITQMIHYEKVPLTQANVNVEGCDGVELAYNQQCTLAVSALQNAYGGHYTLAINHGEWSQNINIAVEHPTIQSVQNSYQLERTNGIFDSSVRVNLLNNHNFSIPAVSSINDIFELKDQAGHAVSSSDMEIKEVAGASCIYGLLPGLSCAVDITSKGANLELGQYALYSKGALAALKVADIHLNATSNSLNKNTTLSLPPQMLPQRSANHHAVLTNPQNSTTTYQVMNIGFPKHGGNISYHGAVGVGALCWNGAEGAQLSPGQSCLLDFDYVGEIGDHLQGDLSVQLKDVAHQHIVNETYVNAFDTQVVDALSNPVGELSAQDFNIHPGGMATLMLTNTSQDEALNGIVLDLTNMPAALFNRISERLAKLKL